MQTHLGNKLRKLRLFKGYSQKYMAIKLDISQRAYSKIELNQTKLSLDKAIKISKIFEISTWELLSIDEQVFFKTIKEFKNEDPVFKLKTLIEKYDNRIKALEDEIEHLKNKKEI